MSLTKDRGDALHIIQILFLSGACIWQYRKNEYFEQKIKELTDIVSAHTDKLRQLEQEGKIKDGSLDIAKEEIEEIKDKIDNLNGMNSDTDDVTALYNALEEYGMAIDRPSENTSKRRRRGEVRNPVREEVPRPVIRRVPRNVEEDVPKKEEPRKARYVSSFNKSYETEVSYPPQLPNVQALLMGD